MKKTAAAAVVAALAIVGVLAGGNASESRPSPPISLPASCVELQGSSVWQSVLFVEPKYFTNGTGRHLMPFSFDDCIVRAVNGQMSIAFSTNFSSTVSVGGGETYALTTSPVLLNAGDTLRLGRQISLLYYKGDGSASFTVIRSK